MLFRILRTSNSYIVLTTLLGILFLKSFSLDKTLTLHGKSTSNAATLVNEEFQDAWKLFADAILKQDIKSIKALSTDCIMCTDCFTNTPLEDSLFKKIQKENPDTWYQKLYNDFSFVPVDHFIKEDFDIIFNEKVKLRLLNKSKLIYIDDNHNAKVYAKPCVIGTASLNELDFQEVLLTYIDPTPKFEGSQRAFAFVKIKGQYKFCGFSTIP